MKYKLLIILLLLAAPVMATDYGFGGDTTGTSSAGRNDSAIYVDTFTTAVAAGNLDSVAVWLKNNYHGPHSIAVVIYDTDSNIVDSTAHFTVSVSDLTRFRADFIEGAAVSASTKYFVGLHAASAGGIDGNYLLGVKIGLTPILRYKNDLSTIPAAMTGTTAANGNTSMIWAFYHDAVAATSKKLGAAKLGAGKW